MNRTTDTVVGMTCEHCVRAVRAEVGALPGVTGVDVDLGSGCVTVVSSASVDPTAFASAVDEAGYTVAP